MPPLPEQGFDLVLAVEDRADDEEGSSSRTSPSVGQKLTLSSIFVFANGAVFHADVSAKRSKSNTLKTARRSVLKWVRNT